MGFGHISLLSKLWSNYIVPLGYYSESVKHALIALGCSHRAFLDDWPDEHGLGTQQMYKEMATRQYAKAIYCTSQDMNDLSPTTIRTSLVSCLVFICLEIIQGRYDKAMQHLRSGSRIMRSLAEAATSTHTSAVLSPTQRCMAETVSNYYDQLCDVSDMFMAIGCDTAYLLEQGEVIPDLSFFFRGGHNSSKDSSEPFTSADEARYALHLVDEGFGKFLGYSFRGSLPMPWTDFLNVPEDMSPIEEEGWPGEWVVARHRFDVWSARLAAYTKNLKSDPSTPQSELWEVRLLSFMQMDWSLIIKCLEAPTTQHSHRQAFQDLLEDAESLVYAEDAELKHPVFTLAADVIPRMVFIAGYSGELDLQQRAIALLYAMRRKEGMWDSREIASVLEAILAARECSTWDKEYEKVSLPRLAKMLESLKLYEGNGTIPMATLVDQVAS
ncbi:C6 zinc finger domain protein [Colletotrichum karsti]|uniref:C6 zinc finger domain protein n=1 Tax=Colletotrichum karsti TaxID=1095194 RepID=A0A9P6LF32_9PEZI|nr:C6 zinc finger domain protein [Colletotrichum karsti]KAF9873749.1 C6 zinc finger domain protein [Colletotrichum karsti]